MLFLFDFLPSTEILEVFLNIDQLGLPWWLSGKEVTCQCRRQGFDPWSRKIPHAVEQLSSRAAAIEPVP